VTVAIVRLLDANDLEAFRRIRLESLRKAPFAFRSSAEDWEALSDDEWRRRLAERLVFGAFVEDALVGLMGLITERRAKDAHRATIVMVYVRERFRRQGVSTKLLDALTDHALRLGIRRLELVASVENLVALSFYRRNGYVEVGRIPGGYLMNGREVDEILMARRIDKSSA
jgi:RimJ/RimL family protein N-acetyltransferase